MYSFNRQEAQANFRKQNTPGANDSTWGALNFPSRVYAAPPNLGKASVSWP
jgi:hypothetical protein